MPTISPEISVKIAGLLKSMGKVSEQSISEAKKKYEGNGKTPLGILTYLLEDKKIAEDDLVTAVSRNYALRKVLLNEQAIKKDAISKVPKDFITQNEMIPFELNGRILKVAIFDPTKSILVGKLKSMTGCNIELYIAKPSNIDEALRYKTITELGSDGTEEKKKTTASQPVNPNLNVKLKVPTTKSGDENVVVDFVDQLLLEAFLSEASDIHIEVFRRGEANIRFRKDGVLQLQDQFKTVLMDNYNAVVTRLKIMSGCDISEKRLPQDGKLKFKNPKPKSEDDVDIDVRFSVIPAKEGERVVMRLLAAGPDLALEQIGLDPDDYDKLITAITAPQGMVLVTGPTGSGKSTLLDIIMGLLSPTKGALEIDGKIINQENNRSWQANIAHVPQTIFLTDSTIEKNIAFGIPNDAIDKNKVIEAAKQAQIFDFIETLPNKYQTSVGERGVQLSGGQRQRIGIARALYKEADIIIFDEATSALDAKTEEAVMSSIENLGRELTLLIIAHRITTLKNCSQIIELKNGEVVRSDSYKNIYKDLK